MGDTWETKIMSKLHYMIKTSHGPTLDICLVLIELKLLCLTIIMDKCKASAGQLAIRFWESAHYQIYKDSQLSGKQHI